VKLDHLNKLMALIVRLIRPDVDAIIAAFVKSQRKLEAFVNRELAAIEAETGQIDALFKSRSHRNFAVDRAYRVIDRLDKLTA
jgi:hypothetical protein